MDDATREQDIWCSVVGDADISTAICIRASNDDEVQDLKEKVYKKGKGRFKGLVVSDLVLWKLIAPIEKTSFTPPGIAVDLSEIAVKLDPTADVSALGFADRGFQILVQEPPPRVKDLKPRKRPHVSEDSTLGVLVDEAWPSKAWAAGWGKEATITHSSGHSIMPADLWSSTPILVRGEYEEIWKYIENQRSRSRKNVGGLVVWGQPGIGKSVLLQFVLAKALEIKRPVAFCNGGSSFYFFSKHGARVIDLATLRRRPLSEDTLALYDSRGPGEPPIEFTEPASEAFVVQSTSPRISRWEEWCKQRSAQVWTMDPWSESEIVTASKILCIKMRTGHYSPLELFHLLGPSARHCLRPLDYIPRENTGDPNKDLGPFNPSFSLADIDQIVLAMSTNDIPESLQESEFHTYFYARRMPGVTNPHRAPQCTCDIPTRFLRQMLSDSLVKALLVHQATSATKFMSRPQVAGIFYEQVAVMKLSLPGNALRCQLLNGLYFDLTCQLNVPKGAASFDAPFMPQNNTLYTTPLAYPSIHAIAITDQGQRITLLHMTTAEKHNVDLGDIKKVVRSLGPKPSTVCWAFIFVTPSAKRGRALSTAVQSIRFTRHTRQTKPRKNQKKKTAPPLVTHIDVGWAVVKERDEAFQAVIASLSESIRDGY